MHCLTVGVSCWYGAFLATRVPQAHFPYFSWLRCEVSLCRAITQRASPLTSAWLWAGESWERALRCTDGLRIWGGGGELLSRGGVWTVCPTIENSLVGEEEAPPGKLPEIDLQVGARRAPYRASEAGWHVAENLCRSRGRDQFAGTHNSPALSECAAASALACPAGMGIEFGGLMERNVKCLGLPGVDRLSCPAFHSQRCPSRAAQVCRRTSGVSCVRGMETLKASLGAGQAVVGEVAGGADVACELGLRGL